MRQLTKNLLRSSIGDGDRKSEVLEEVDSKVSFLFLAQPPKSISLSVIKSILSLVFHIWRLIGDVSVRGPAEQRRRWWLLVKGVERERGPESLTLERDIGVLRESDQLQASAWEKYNGLTF